MIEIDFQKLSESCLLELEKRAMYAATDHLHKKMPKTDTLGNY
jgi:hypothetical protein